MRVRLESEVRALDNYERAIIGRLREGERRGNDRGMI
jgi:hypothetical protein